MSCRNCNSYPCQCTCYSSNCADICTSIYTENSWNVPACDASATVTIPGVKNFLVGAYIWNASYGYFLVTSWNAVTGQLTIQNNCASGNAVAGTLVPAYTQFVVSAPPPDSILNVWEDYSTSVTYSASAAMTFGTVTTEYYKYLPENEITHFVIRFDGIVAGVPDYIISFTLPTPAVYEQLAGEAIYIQSNGADQVGIWRVSADGLKGEVIPLPIFTWGAGPAAVNIRSFYRNA